MHFSAHFSMQVPYKDKSFFLEAGERTPCGEIFVRVFPMSRGKVERDRVIFSVSVVSWEEAIRLLMGANALIDRMVWRKINLSEADLMMALIEEIC